MIRNYLVVALRNMFKQKVHSFINIFGLSLGIALSILIFMFVRSEFSYDTFHENGDKIYRVNQKISGHNGTRFLSATPLPLCDALEDNYPEISQATRLGSSSMVVKNGENVFNETVTFVDVDFFEMFSFPVIAGNKQKPLLSLSSLVLSKGAALKYFGSEDPIGKAITIQMADSNRVFVVSAIADNMKDISSIPFDFIIQIDNVRGFFPPDYFTSYKPAFIETFIQTSETTTQQDLESKFPLFVQRVIAVSDQDEAVELFLQPLTDIHLNSDLPETISQISNRFYSYALAGLGVLVLFIASINFITLSLGRMTGRAKEVGIRKVVGAVRAQLAQQYLGEALITTTFALGVFLMIAYQTLPFFNSLSGKALVFAVDLSLIVFLVALGLLLSVLAGSYPSILLSGFQPVTVLKGVVKFSGNNFFSRGLVVLQFSLSTFLIIGTLVMRGQVEFFREKSLGYDKERVVDISMNNPASPEAANRLFHRFRSEIINDIRIVGVSSAMNRFGIPWTQFKFEQDDGTPQSIFFNQVDHDYLRTMGVELLVGRDFSNEFSTDLSESIIVNEALVRHFDWQDPLNEQIPGSRFEKRHRIIGVAKDFHFTSLHQEVRPLILALGSDAILSGVTGLSTWNWPPQLNHVLVRIDAEETQPIVDFLKNSWAKVSPEAPFELTFLDDTIDAQYAEEQKWTKIINYTSVLAIIIACLGLFGLTTVAVVKRVKEIGIRKVLGASMSSIAWTISKDLLLLVVIANCIAWPLAYFASQLWLQDFTYRIDVSIWYFLLSSLLATGIAFLTISSQTVKAALANPVHSLRSE